MTNSIVDSILTSGELPDRHQYEPNLETSGCLMKVASLQVICWGQPE